MTKVNSPGKYHGGKQQLASKIVNLFPPRASAENPDGYITYVEPYFGMGAVLFANDPEGISEVANDLNGELTNFWRVLQDDAHFTRFQRIIEATPFSEREFRGAVRANDLIADYPVESAVNFFIRCRQSLAGRMNGFTGITKTRVRRGMNNEVSAWLTAIEGLPAVHNRLKRVLILSRSAIEVIQYQDGPRTLHYVDCPYLHSTRVTKHEYGPYEMSYNQHIDLLDVLSSVKGRFLLSGYRSELYDAYKQAKNWNRHDFEVANSASGAKRKRRMVECVWTNY